MLWAYRHAQGVREVAVVRDAGDLGNRCQPTIGLGAAERDAGSRPSSDGSACWILLRERGRPPPADLDLAAIAKSGVARAIVLYAPTAAAIRDRNDQQRHDRTGKTRARPPASAEGTEMTAARATVLFLVARRHAARFAAPPACSSPRTVPADAPARA